MKNTLRHVEVVTNSRRIFYELGKPNVPIRTIIIGGTQQERTEAVCGHMAEQFIEAMDLRCCMAIVGTTAIDTENPVIGADFFADARIKGMLLSRAWLKVVVAVTKRKCVGNISKAFHAVGAITPDFIDIVVVDAEDKALRACLEKAKVGMLVAPDYVRRKAEKDFKAEDNDQAD